jgi:hypothetical protein
MRLQGLLVYTHGAGSVLWQWDHGGIAPNLRVSRRAVPMGMTMTMICSDEVTFVGEGKLASLNSIAQVGGSSPALHFWVGGSRSCVAVSEAPAQVG